MNISQEVTCLNDDSWNMTSYRLSPLDVSLFVMNFVIGFPAHSYVLWLIITSSERGIASEIFIFNMFICEIMFCTHSLFCAIAENFPRLIDVAMFLSGFVSTGRLFQCLMCVERYLAVVHPVTFLKFKPLRYRVACCAFTWIMISISCVFCMHLVSPRHLKLFTGFFLSQFFIFISINFYCCLAVLRALKQSGPGDRGREKEEDNHMKRRAFNLILITTVSLIMYFLGCVTSFLYLLSIYTPPELSSFANVCYMLAGFVQPVLYIQRVKKICFFRT